MARNAKIDKITSKKRVIKVPPGLEPRLAESESAVITNYTMEPHFTIRQNIHYKSKNR
jgi:hypothetical protein